MSYESDVTRAIELSWVESGLVPHPLCWKHTPRPRFLDLTLAYCETCFMLVLQRSTLPW